MRRSIFTFANFPDRIAPRDIPKVIRGIDQADLVTAIAGATTPELTRAAEYVLENMSGRMADALREEVKDAGKVKPKDAETAMSAIVSAVRELEASGELLLIAGEEEE